MKRLQSILLAATATLALGAAGSAICNAASLPTEYTQGKVQYMSGGGGHDEAMAMQKQESRFPLSLEFVRQAKPTNEYLADIDVRIKDRNGNTELDTRSEGPFLLAKLPPGKYHITANDDGRVQTRDVVIDANKPQHVVFAW